MAVLSTSIFPNIIAHLVNASLSAADADARTDPGDASASALAQTLILPHAHDRTPLLLTLGFFYLLLLALVAIQLFQIIYARHQLLSFQSGFLLFTAFWLSVRAFLFLVPSQPTLLGYFLEWLPTTIQTATFLLLAMFYAYLVDRPGWEHAKAKWQAATLATILLLTLLTLVSIFTMDSLGFENALRIHLLVTAAVFLILSLLFIFYSYKLYDVDLHHKSLTPAAPPQPTTLYSAPPSFTSTNGTPNSPSLRKTTAYSEYLPPPAALFKSPTSISRLIAIAAALGCLFLSRAGTDVALAFGFFDWLTPDSHRSVVGLRETPIASFFMLVAWEVLPTVALIIHFWNIPTRAAGAAVTGLDDEEAANGAVELTERQPSAAGPGPLMKRCASSSTSLLARRGMMTSPASTTSFGALDTSAWGATWGQPDTTINGTHPATSTFAASAIPSASAAAAAAAVAAVQGERDLPRKRDSTETEQAGGLSWMPSCGSFHTNTNPKKNPTLVQVSNGRR